MGNSYVVIDPHAVGRMDLITPSRAATVLDAASHKLIRPGRQLPVANGVIADKNWQGRVGDTLLVTRCSTRYAVCVTTYVNLPELVSARRGQLIAYGSLGGLTGALFGLSCLLLYRRNSSMAQQLRRAIRNDRLQVVYQPIVNLSSGRIVGAEALARWTDEEGFAVGPDVFVKVAERRGFVEEITRLVMQHAVRDFAETMRNWPAFHLSINVTAGDLENKGLLPMMEGILERSGISPQSMVVEVTEGSMVHRDLAIETIGALRKRGYGVHIDDFGTGYSSLSYLHSLAVDAIKIDKSFTQAIGTEAVTLSIIPQILAMAKMLNLQVVVEGIETEAQVRYFDPEVQPIFGQGWYFGHPVPAERFHALLAEEEVDAAPLRTPSLARAG
jgi:sensor c-di-GMP phosphodiesterase-like protein